MAKTEHRRWMIRTRLLGTTGALLFAGTLYLYSRFLSTCPSVPDVKLNRIYPLNIHGWIVYLNQMERTGLNVIQGTTVACMLAFVLMVQFRPQVTNLLFQEVLK